MGRKGISVTKDAPGTEVINRASELVVRFFDWNTGQNGFIQFCSSPGRNLRVTVYGHTERVFVDEGHRERA